MNIRQNVFFCVQSKNESLPPV